MKKEEIEKLTNLDLDELIALYVFNETYPRGYYVPEYSSDISLAWEVIEEMTKPPSTTSEATSQINTKFVAWFDNSNIWVYTKEEAAKEICKAALFILHNSV